ncbi:ATP-binding protein [Paenibacillus sp. SAFN-117]|uniref:ATP-binding protein n=1 Tax=Paenibacillus sp. SAFN-117 TaxID=3436860 RepID=UPI003F7D37AE
MSSLSKGRSPLTIEHVDAYIQAFSSQCVIVVDGEGLIADCSAALLQEAGYTLQELKGMSLQQLGIESSFSILQDQYLEAVSQSSLNPIIRLRNCQGDVMNRRYAIVSLQTLDGRPYFSIHMDRVCTEEELSLLQKFAGTFMKDINLGVILIDVQFRIVDISDMACRVLGLHREKVVNKPVTEVFNAVPSHHQLIQPAILNGVVVRNHAVSWTNNEDRYELLLDSNVLKDEAGRTVGAYVIFKDVTNLRSLEQQVQRSDRLAMIGQIAAGTAHEIRNPLTSIKGFMQVLKNTFIEKGMVKEQEYTDIMLTEINRINELVSEFLLLSKPKNVSYHKVDIKLVMREILPIISNEALLHGVSVQYDAIPGLPKVIADSELLKQVFLNLCKNGIEAMADGGILTITEKVDYEELMVHIEIHDTGPGIPNFVIDKIFDPFFTTKENGTGLGLSVCQRIIHDIGGTIRVASKGYGTTFSVSIPFP